MSVFCVFAFTAVVNERAKIASVLPSTISKSCSSLLFIKMYTRGRTPEEGGGTIESSSDSGTTKRFLLGIGQHQAKKRHPSLCVSVAVSVADVLMPEIILLVSP